MIKQEQANRKQRFIGKKSVVFTINGQVHGFYRNTKIKEWGLPSLKDSLLIHIDCTDMKINFRQDLFMADRYNFRESKKLDRFIDKIRDGLRSNQKLKELNEKRKNDLLRGTENGNEEEIIKNILSKNPAYKELTNLFKKGNFLKGKDKEKESVKKTIFQN